MDETSLSAKRDRSRAPSNMTKYTISVIIALLGAIVSVLTSYFTIQQKFAIANSDRRWAAISSLLSEDPIHPVRKVRALQEAGQLDEAVPEDKDFLLFVEHFASEQSRIHEMIAFDQLNNGQSRNAIITASRAYEMNDTSCSALTTLAYIQLRTAIDYPALNFASLALRTVDSIRQNCPESNYLQYLAGWGYAQVGLDSLAYNSLRQAVSPPERGSLESHTHAREYKNHAKALLLLSARNVGASRADLQAIFDRIDSKSVASREIDSNLQELIRDINREPYHITR